MARPEAQEEASKLSTELWEQRYQHEALPADAQSHQRISNILSKVQPKKTFHLRYWTAAAACALVLLGSALWLNQTGRNSSSGLAMVTFSAGPGERKVITMPDHSIVHLNAGSTISYNASYNRQQREVVLHGEAFFDVAEDPQKPFSVKHDNLSTQVLGTSFNISAFPNAPVRVTVATGAVRVNGATDSVLTAGQELIYDRAAHTAVIIKPEHAGQAYAWKDGVLAFDSERLDSISIVLERWYNVRIHLEGKDLENCRFTGTFEQLPVNKVLDLLSRHSGCSYRITGKDIYISGPGCR